MANTATSRSYRATGIGLLALHLGALAAFVPQFFTWSALGVAVGLYYLTGGIGISLGFHRILTHRSLRCPRWLEYGLAICGTLALQGGPIEWVATHRAHHAHTDREGDPHDVHRGLPWAHARRRPNSAASHRTSSASPSTDFSNGRTCCGRSA
jgi:fatty-acid desaturase